MINNFFCCTRFYKTPRAFAPCRVQALKVRRAFSCGAATHQVVNGMNLADRRETKVPEGSGVSPCQGPQRASQRCRPVLSEESFVPCVGWLMDCKKSAVFLPQNGRYRTPPSRAIVVKTQAFCQVRGVLAWDLSRGVTFRPTLRSANLGQR